MENNKKYGLIKVLSDGPECVEGLWDLTQRFLQSENITLDKSQSFLHLWHMPNIFYNNFEISHVSLWKSKLWLKYAEYVDLAFGIYLLRWGDAPLHTLGVAMMLSSKQVHTFSDIGYRHDPMLLQPPAGLPSPFTDLITGNDGCEYYDSWNCNNANHSTNSTHFNFTNYPLSQASTSYRTVLKGIWNIIFTNKYLFCFVV